MPSPPEVELDELYRDLILDHSRRPRNRKTLDEPKLVGEGYNPLCGDEVEVELRLDGDVIADVGFGGRGCSISQASVSMMTEAVRGKNLEDARLLITDFLRMMTEPGATPSDRLGDLEAFLGVAKYPVRVKCATLAWHALRELLARREQGA
ncbi:MAG: Fe-S cluster assembly sulfur transfer protein SufU [Dehalococcoidia bacterium]|jgi:nitrogen fixation NifU-like protein